MASVNATRSKSAKNVSDAVSDARLIGFNDSGLACVWFGGYSFSVYDVARDWNEVKSFTSGDLAGMSSAERKSDKGTEYAISRMYSEGFTPVTTYYE